MSVIVPEQLGQEEIDALAREALSRWGLEGAALHAINRTENAIYRVLPPAPRAQTILRVHREGYHTINGIRTELAWMRALQQDTGIKTPQAILGLDGDIIQLVGTPQLPRPRHCVLFEFIEGAEPAPGRDLIAPFRQLGEMAARTHVHSIGWRRPPYFERLVWDFEHCLGATPNWGPWRAGPELSPERERLLERAIALVERRLARFGKGAGRFGLIHADFRLANLLIHEGDVRVIDFDDCGLGWFLYDVATAVSLIEDDPDLESLLAAWVEGYRRVRPLAKEDEAEIRTFIMLRRLTVFAWFGSHAETVLAQQAGPGYCAYSCEMAERYLSRFG